MVCARGERKGAAGAEGRACTRRRGRRSTTPTTGRTTRAMHVSVPTRQAASLARVGLDRDDCRGTRDSTSTPPAGQGATRGCGQSPPPLYSYTHCQDLWLGVSCTNERSVFPSPYPTRLFRVELRALLPCGPGAPGWSCTRPSARTTRGGPCACAAGCAL